MSKFQVADLVCVKTTGEKVLIMKTSDSVLTCSRGQVSEQGLNYVEDKFFPFELETMTERMYRAMEEQIALAELERELQHRLMELQAKDATGVDVASSAKPKKVSDPSIN